MLPLVAFASVILTYNENRGLFLRTLIISLH